MKQLALCSRLLSSLFFISLYLISTLQAEETDKAFSHIESGVKSYTLPNGLKVLFYQRGIAPVFAGAVVVRVGGTDESSGKGGIAHLLEHMAFKGNKNIGTKDWEKEKILLDEQEGIEQKANLRELTQFEKERLAQINTELQKLWKEEEFSRLYELQGAAGMNATTDPELTRYFVNLPRAAFEFWCQMESDRLIDPVMRQFYKERDVVREERRTRYEDDPGGKLWELLMGASFRVHPYRNPVIGYDFDIKRLTASDLEAFHKKYYVPGNIVLSLVGRVNPEEDIRIVEKYFGSIPTAALPERPHAIEPEQKGERLVNLRERGSPEVLISYHKVAYPNPEDPAITLMLEILAGSKVSPLYKSLVLQRQVAVSVSQQEGPGTLSPNLMIFNLVPRAPYGDSDVLKAFDAEIEKFISRQVKLEELQIAKRAVAMDYLQGFDSNMNLALSIAAAQIGYGDWKTALTWYYDAMKVTPEDISRVAKKYLSRDNRTVGFLEKAELGGAQK